MDDAFPFVHVNHDGTVREVTDSEQAFLTTTFAPDDGARPYVKAAMEDRDGQGQVSGFMARANLPPGTPVRSVKRRQDTWNARRLPFETHTARTDTGFPMIYVNHDGTAREVSPEERVYLTATYAPGDGNRPYVKETYGTLTPDGFQWGFMHRARLPADVTVWPVNPRFDEIVRTRSVPYREMSIREAEVVGDLVTPLEDGSIMFSPNPDIPHAERMARYRRVRLEVQLEREAWARVEDDAGD